MDRPPLSPTWFDVAFLGVVLVVVFVGALVALWTQGGEISDLEYENSVLRSELELRATLIPPPGVLWTRADTLICYPQSFDR